MLRLGLLGLLLPLLGHGAEPALGTVVSFVGCPIYRNTEAGRKSGCWLADETRSGQRYDVSQGITKPQLGREVLVEGVVAAQDGNCGGVVLLPMRASTLDSSCPVALIPAEGFPGRRYVSPPDQLRPAWEPRELPPGPYVRQDYRILFDFGSDFLNYQYSETILERISLYARASNARTVRVTGYAATAPLVVSGRRLAEPATLAMTRAQMVAEALRRLEVPATRILVEARSAPAVAVDAGALREASKRRVDVRIEP